jgi:tRNA threonylcarbamoyladenosine biosynthesis protein TsaB
MIVLGFDTATPSTAVGLRLADGMTLQVRDDPGREEHPDHATRLLAMIAGLLGEAGVGWSALDRIAVGVGPGRFTGLRVGVATARGLAQSRGIELVGVSSLLALAQAAARRGEEDRNRQGVLAVIDARRGEAFAAAYAPVDGSAMDRERAMPRELAAPRALASAGLAEVLKVAAARAERVARWVAVGDGAVLYRGELEALGVCVPPEGSPLHRVSGEAICEIAASSAAQAIDMVLPDYRRRPDAEIALERAGGVPGTGVPETGVPETGVPGRVRT